MAFSLFSRSQKEEHLIAVFDIGSASVAGALVLIKEKEEPKIIYSVRKDMAFQEELDFNRFQSSMRGTLAVVARDLERNGLSHLTFTHLGSYTPERVYCTLSSPWYVSQTRFTSYVPKEKFRVTKKIIQDLTEGEVEAFKKSSAVMEHVGKQEAVKVIEKKTVQVKLNGYDTPAPYDKEAVQMNLTTLISVAPKETLNEIAEEIRRVFAIEHVEFNAFPTVFFDVVRSSLKAPEHFMLIDVSGELTDVSLVRGDVLLETSTFPRGKKSIIRTLASAVGTSPEEASSLIHLYHEGKLEDEQKKRVEKALESARGEWMSLFQKALRNLSEDFSVPSTVYLSADNDLVDFLEKLVEQEELNQFTAADDIFKVTPITTEILHDACRFGKHSLRDPFLMLGAVFADRVFDR